MFARHVANIYRQRHMHGQELLLKYYGGAFLLHKMMSNVVRGIIDVMEGLCQYLKGLLLVICCDAHCVRC